MSWYGLYCDGELIAVIQWRRVPSIYDFRMYYSSENDYEVLEVEVTPIRTH
jgi:hypothetical protein